VSPHPDPTPRPDPTPQFIRDRLDSGERRRHARDGYRRAAVLIPLVAAHRDWEVVLTRRNGDLPHHRGQIAFPGGSADPGETCVQAALREAYEEIGLDPAHVEVLGCHDDIWTPSGFIISPVIGILAGHGPFAPNPDEVARVFSVPLSFFADEQKAERQVIRHDGVDREVYFYHWDGETIWGATALILRNFLSLLGLIDDRRRSIA
jgi:8-oxo-dGTP pyrophosphatase MutT (NUDIX family)